MIAGNCFNSLGEHGSVMKRYKDMQIRNIQSLLQVKN